MDESIPAEERDEEARRNRDAGRTRCGVGRGEETGTGKGGVEFWCAIIKPGTILFEVSGVPASMAREAMRLADGKLPFKCRFVVREGVEIL